MNKIENIDELISKFLSGNALPEEAMLIDDWRNASVENERYFLGCEKIFRHSNNELENKAINKAKAWNKINHTLREKGLVRTEQKGGFSYLAIAATLAIVMSIALFFQNKMSQDTGEQLSYETAETAIDFRLKDNSKIELYKHSKLLLDKGFGVKNRTVYLKGNASFTVIHNQDLPFVVDAGSFYIKDIGTKFSVIFSANEDTIYVNVFEGIVMLYDSLGAELELKAAQNAIYIRSKKQLLSGAYLYGQNVHLKFDDTSLDEVILQLNERYNTKIELQNMKLNKCTITTEFDKEELQTVLTIICETLGLSYEKTQTGYLIKGEKCWP